MKDSPLVTCLCLTMAGRNEFLKRAIDCFLRQTYPNRELLIVPDSYSDVDEMLGPYSVYADCIDVMVPSKHLNIGQKRNFGCDAAHGEMIAFWDDDDYSGPERLETQIEILQQTGKSVTACDEMLFTDGAAWWRFMYAEGFGAGTSLVFRRDWWLKHRFDEQEYGMMAEDSRFITEAHRAREFFYTAGKKDLMYATLHPGNTSKYSPDVDREWVRIPEFEWKD